MMNCTFRKTSTGFVSEGNYGSSIDWCVQECVAKARSSGENVTLLNFNGVDVICTPTTTVEEALKSWRDGMDRNAETWRNSPEGKRAAQEAEERAINAQRQVDRLLAQLEDFGDAVATDILITWLAEFSEHADHIAVKYDRNGLIAKLESFGYKANAHVAKTEKEKKAVKNWKRQTMAEYIIGQAISCMKSGMSPHPNLTPRFAQEYAEMGV